MEVTIEFTDETREPIITEQETLGFRLKEEQRHFDGNFLIFTDEPYIGPELPRDLPAEIDDIKIRLAKVGPDPAIDWLADFTAAATATERLDVIARRLGLK